MGNLLCWYFHIQKAAQFIPSIICPADLKEQLGAIREIFPDSPVMPAVGSDVLLLLTKWHGMSVSDIPELCGTRAQSVPPQAIKPFVRAGPACQNEFGIIVSPIHLFVDKGPRPILKALELIGVFKKPL
ncbi:hypothetical protein GGP97_002765 [Salinibacter ruber]|nr:hypothetical protein [Salinibacter ruber]MCS4174828.1 hypothetical protein [Salinibacter ruber]